MLNFQAPEEGVFARLPEVYKKFYNDLYKAQPKPVHYIPEPGRYKKDPETGVM